MAIHSNLCWSRPPTSPSSLFSVKLASPRHTQKSLAYVSVAVLILHHFFLSCFLFQIPANYASALAIELRRGSPPDVRDFLRVKFKNGTRGFETVHVFDHHEDIPLTEFIYRAEVCLNNVIQREYSLTTILFLQNAAITSNKQWMEVCGIQSETPSMSSMDILGFKPESHIFQNCILGFAATMFIIFGLVKFIKNRRASQRRPQLVGEEVSQAVYNTYGSITHRGREENVVYKAGEEFVRFRERQSAEENYFPEHPRWIL